MKRRSFIQNTAAASVAAFVPAGLLAAPAAGWQMLAHPEVLSIIGEQEARAVGRTYRNTFTAHDSPVELAEAIRRDVTRSLSEQAGIDFAEGRTITLNGWVLSLTEARQCALFSLLPS